MIDKKKKKKSTTTKKTPAFSYLLKLALDRCVVGVIYIYCYCELLQLFNELFTISCRAYMEGKWTVGW